MTSERVCDLTHPLMNFPDTRPQGIFSKIPVIASSLGVDGSNGQADCDHLLDAA